MNRFINALLIFLLFPIMLLTITVAFDLPVGFLRSSGANMPYKEIAFLSLGLLVLIINLRRSIRRWMGMRIVNNVKKFKWNIKVSDERRRRVNTYLAIEVVIFIAVGTGLYILTEEAWMPAFAYIFGGADCLVFLIVGYSGKTYRVGLSSKALIVADREVNVLYFTGLRKVSVHQQSIYFDYIKDLQLHFPIDCVPEDLRDEFFDTLEDTTDRDKVYFRRKRS